jgi:periplasmic protein TonB
MPPTAKDFDLSPSSPQTTSGPSASGTSSPDSAGKPQPVALEVPVTVNGARTVEGSDKREPFSETTQTVLVFGNGAVIRLASSVATGQLLFLTNEKTKKEVVCQVVKSKNYRNVSGYVELEFTEAMSGFWGMRFPGERPAAPPSTPPLAATKNMIAPSAPTPKAAAPPVNTLPKRPESQPVPAPPVRTETVTTSALHAEVKSPLNLPRAAEPKPAAPQPKAPVVANTFGSGVTSSSRGPEIKPQAPVASKVPPAPAAPVNAHPSTDALKRESERLQAQLSSMLFTPEVPARPASPASANPSASKPASIDSISKVIEMAKQQAPSVKQAPPAKSASPEAKSALDAEEVRIPSWLEPLARNAATPAHNEIETESQDALTEIEFEVQDVSAPPTTQETANVAPAETELSLLLSEATSAEKVSVKSNKGILIGAIAAGVLLAAAGGTWYVRQSSTPAQQTAAAAAAPPAASTAAVAQTPSKRGAEASSVASAKVGSGPAASLSSTQPSGQSLTPTAEPLRTASDKTAAAELSAYKKLGEPQPRPAMQPPPKKPSLGEVHLAAPAVNRPAATSDNGAADLAPTLNGGQVSPAGDALGGGLAAGSNKQPAAPPAPLPVGGDVRQARLISSTPPVYPVIARNQHVQGDVRIDALIDVDGKVSAMKVISGPVLLHQAAMDALRQWKYQAATLDGKPVPMHLTVTVQFHLQ